MPHHKLHRLRLNLIRALAMATFSWWSLAGLVAPVQAGSCGSISLDGGTVSPSVGTTETTFTFSVRVTDKSGKKPDWVRVQVNGVWSNMTPLGTDYKVGVTYNGTRRLPVGSWPYRFGAMSAGGTPCQDATVTPTAVTVNPAATPKPTATPTPKPTAKPTPKPTPKATPKPTAKTTAKPTPKPTAKATAVATVKPAGSASPSPSGAPTGSTPSQSPIPGSPTPTPTASPRPASGIVVPHGGGPAGGGSGNGPTLDATVFLRGATSPFIVWLVTTGGGLMLFLLLLRRWRDDDLRTSELVPAMAVSTPAAPAVPAEPRPPREPDPSAGRTRAAGRATMLPPVPPRLFEKPAAKGVERARIGYRRVRISSKPDAVRAVERGRLDRGDEVEILDSYEGFLEIRTPDGITGWILRHTIVGAPS